MNFNLFMPVKVVSGEGCIQQNKQLLKELGNRCLIITGKHSASASGALTDVTHALNSLGISHTQYDGVTENPTINSAKEAADLAIEFKADFIVGIGGGSALDASKAASLFAANAHLNLMDIFNPEIWINKPLPWVACGITAGTGSEVTAVSVLTVIDQHIKKSITHPALYARLAFADPRYTHSCNTKLTCSAAVDAIAHAVEAYFSAVASDVTDQFALHALSILCPALQKLTEGMVIDADIRAGLYYGSIWAGLALNGCGTCFPHPLGYVLTEEHGIPHGFACGVFMPDYMDRANKFAAEKSAALAKSLGFDTSAISNLVQSVTKIDVIKMDDEKMFSIAKRFEGVRNMTNSPGGLSFDETITILKRHFGVC